MNKTVFLETISNTAEPSLEQTLFLWNCFTDSNCLLSLLFSLTLISYDHAIIHFSLEREWLRQSEEEKDFFFDITEEDYKREKKNQRGCVDENFKAELNDDGNI